MFFIALFLFSQRRFDSKTERLHAPVRWTNVSTSIQSFWELKRKCSESWWPFEKLARREETRLSKMRHLKRWRRVIQSSDDTLTRSPIYHRLSFWFDKNKNPGDNSRQQIDKDPGIFLIRKKKCRFGHAFWNAILFSVRFTFASTAVVGSFVQLLAKVALCHHQREWRDDESSSIYQVRKRTCHTDSFSNEKMNWKWRLYLGAQLAKWRQRRRRRRRRRRWQRRLFLNLLPFPFSSFLFTTKLRWEKNASQTRERKKVKGTCSCRDVGMS